MLRTLCGSVQYPALGSGDTLRGLAVGGLTSGLLDPAFDNMEFGKAAGIQSDPINSITRGFDLGTAQGALGFAAHSAGQGLINAGATAAIQGGSFQDHLIGNLESQGNNVLSALAFNQVGSFADYLAETAGTGGNTAGFDLFVEGGLGRTGLHAFTGGAVTELTQGDFMTGAAGAGSNQLLSGAFGNLSGGNNTMRTAGAQLAGLLGAVSTGGDVETGAWIAKQADTYNRQLHKAELKLIADHYQDYADERGISDELALKELLYQAQSQVDGAYAGDSGQRDLAILRGYDQQAAGDFLSTLASQSGTIVHDDGEVTALFEATEEQYGDSYVNATHLHDIEDGAYGEQMFGYPAPILKNMESDIGAGNYLDVIGDARLDASNEMFSQGATVLGGAVLTPVAASVGSAATVQAPFWSGVGAQTAATGSRALGARLIVNAAAAEEGMAVGALRANIVLTDMVYGTGTAAETYVLGSSVAGFFDGLYGVVPGPPAYVPDGAPNHPVLAPYKASQEFGAMLKDAFRFYKEEVSD